MKSQHTLRQSILITFTAVLILSVSASAKQFYNDLIVPNKLYTDAEIEPIKKISETRFAITPEMMNEFFSEETDEKLVTENWMMESQHFGTFIEIEIVNEKQLDLENWMTNDALFTATAVYFEIETEKELETVNWMMESQHFGTFIDIETEDEQKLETKNWMTDETIWE